MNKSIIGIDIGGTHFRIGAVDENGNVTKFMKRPTTEIIRTENVMADLAAFIDGYREGTEVEAVSIGFPATLDRARQTVLQAPNLRCMERLPVVSFLSDKLGLPVLIERDATMALFHDIRKFGIPAEGITCGFYFGTGIGNAIIIDGRPLRGKNGTAGELGHIPVDGSELLCGCGNTGCMENLAGGKYLAGLQKEHYPQVDIGSMFAMLGDDPLLRQFIDRMAEAVATEVNILDPDHVLIGGGIVSMEGFSREALSERIIARTRKPYPAENMEIIYTEDSPEKSVIGAAYYARQQLGNL